MYPNELEAEKYAASSTNISGAEQGSAVELREFGEGVATHNQSRTCPRRYLDATTSMDKIGLQVQHPPSCSPRCISHTVTPVLQTGRLVDSRLCMVLGIAALSPHQLEFKKLESRLMRVF